MKWVIHNLVCVLIETIACKAVRSPGLFHPRDNSIGILQMPGVDESLLDDDYRSVISIGRASREPIDLSNVLSAHDLDPPSLFVYSFCTCCSLRLSNSGLSITGKLITTQSRRHATRRSPASVARRAKPLRALAEILGARSRRGRWRSRSFSTLLVLIRSGPGRWGRGCSFLVPSVGHYRYSFAPIQPLKSP